VRDVLRRAHLWQRLDGRIHATPHQALEAIHGRPAEPSRRSLGIDEREPDHAPSHQEPSHA
jgi:hypothetical protein